MRKQVSNHSGQGRCPFVAVIDVVHDVAGNDSADLAVFDKPPSPPQTGFMDHVVPGNTDAPCFLADPLHLLHFGHRPANGLFDQHMLSRFHGQSGERQVGFQICAHDDRFDLIVANQLFG
jgi:hypothetical protein